VEKGNTHRRRTGNPLFLKRQNGVQAKIPSPLKKRTNREKKNGGEKSDDAEKTRTGSGRLHEILALRKDIFRGKSGGLFVTGEKIEGRTGEALQQIGGGAQGGEEQSRIATRGCSCKRPLRLK